MRHKPKSGITLPELIGVFALVSVLCASLLPHLLEFHQATKLSKLRFNLERLRLRIDEFRYRNGHAPPQLDALFESGHEVVFDNPFSTSEVGAKNRVQVVDVHPPDRSHVSPGGIGGWLYNPSTGGIWADTEPFLEE